MAVTNGGDPPLVVVGPTGVAVAEPPEPLPLVVGSVPLPEGIGAPLPVPRATAVLVGQNVVVKVLVTVVEPFTKVVVPVEVVVELDVTPVDSGGVVDVTRVVELLDWTSGVQLGTVPPEPPTMTQFLEQAASPAVGEVS